MQEIEAQALQSQREISVVRTAIVTKQREKRLLQLTTSEVHSLPQEINVYEGIGKMYVEFNDFYFRPTHLPRPTHVPQRFVLKSVPHLQQRLFSETAELDTDIGNLNKKLHYLETTHRNSKQHITQILSSTQ